MGLMTKCPHCYSRLNDGEFCNVCKIVPTKSKDELTTEEKKVRYHCRALQVVGFLAILGGVTNIIKSVWFFLSAPGTAYALFSIIDFVYGVLFIALGLLLKNYHKASYVGGIVLYGLAVVLSALNFNVAKILIALLLLYYIATPISRKILYKKL